MVDIPNPIDTEVYFPMDKAMLRDKMCLPRKKKIVLFAAAKASDPRKGLEYLIQASQTLAQERDDLFFLIVGTNSEEIYNRLPLPARSMGYIPVSYTHLSAEMLTRVSVLKSASFVKRVC